jgi:hypothetical protein
LFPDGPGRTRRGRCDERIIEELGALTLASTVWFAIEAASQTRVPTLEEAASLLMADTYLSIEPIALALRRGDSDFRLAVDTALSHIYRRGEIVQVFKGAFGPLTTPSPLLNALFQISGLPD